MGNTVISVDPNPENHVLLYNSLGNPVDAIPANRAYSGLILIKVSLYSDLTTN